MEGPVDHARAPQRPPDDDRLKRQPGAMIPPAWKGAGVSSRVHGTLDVGRETQIAYAARASPAARRRRGTYRAVAPSISSRPVTRITFCGQTTQSGVIARNGPGAVRWRMPAVTKAAARRALAMVLAREPIGRLTRTGEGGHARTPGPTDRRRTAVSESAFGSDAFVRSRGLFGPISAPGDYIAMSIAETGAKRKGHRQAATRVGHERNPCALEVGVGHRRPAAHGDRAERAGEWRPFALSRPVRGEHAADRLLVGKIISDHSRPWRLRRCGRLGAAMIAGNAEIA